MPTALLSKPFRFLALAFAATLVFLLASCASGAKPAFDITIHEDKTADVRIVIAVPEPPDSTQPPTSMSGREKCEFLARELVGGWQKAQSKNIGTEDAVICELTNRGASVAEVFEEQIRYEGEEIMLRVDLGIIAAVANTPRNPAADVPLRITFPGAVIDSRLGKVEGNTVTFQHSEIWGEDSLIITAGAKAKRDLTWVYVLVGGAIIALGAVVAFMVYREYKRKKAKKAAQQAPASPLPPQGVPYGYSPAQPPQQAQPQSTHTGLAPSSDHSPSPVPAGQPHTLPDAPYGQVTAQPPQSAPSGYLPPQPQGYAPPALPQDH